MVRREDFAAQLHDRERTLRDAELGTLRGLARTARQAAPMRRHAEARAETHAQASGGRPGGSTRTANSRMRKNAPPWLAGLAQVQEARSAWTRADLVHAIVQNLPDHANSQDQEATSPTACAGRTGRASTGPGGQAVRHPAQLSIGQQLLADAYAEGAPRLAYEQAAAVLGVGHRWSDSHAIGDLIMALAFTRAMVLAVASTAAY